MIIERIPAQYSDRTPIAPGDELGVHYPDLHGIPHRGLVYQIHERSFGVFRIVIAHNSKLGGVCTCSLEEFAQGQLVRLLRRPSSPDHARQILDRAAQAFGSRYDVLRQNCEHFTDWCYNGLLGESSTLQAGVLVTSLLMLGLAAWAGERS